MANLLLTNVGFETGNLTGWVSVGSGSGFNEAFNSGAHSGTWLGRLGVIVASWGLETASANRAAVTAGTIYRCEVWGKTAGFNVPVVITVEFYDNAGVSKGSATLFNGTDTSPVWKKWTVDAAAPAGATKAGIKVLDGTAGYTYYIDDASIDLAPLPPAAPSLLAVTHPAPFQLHIAWQDNSSDETSFIVQRSVNSGAFADWYTAAANATSCDDTTVTAGNNYAYKVCAVNSGGRSSYSNTDNFTIPSPPAAPSLATAAISSPLHVLVGWQDNSSDETGFVVQQKMDSGGFADLITKAANSTSHTDNTVAPEHTYAYRVRAVNDYGNSSYSNEASVTIPAPPSLQVTGVQSMTGVSSITD